MTIKPTAASAAELAWIKSSYSTNEGPQCIEVAAAPGMVHVRDSKDKEGPQLAFSPGEWSAFVDFASHLG
jgi:hypothetical protein